MRILRSDPDAAASLPSRLTALESRWRAMTPQGHRRLLGAATISYEEQFGSSGLSSGTTLRRVKQLQQPALFRRASTVNGGDAEVPKLRPVAGFQTENGVNCGMDEVLKSELAPQVGLEPTT